MTKNIDFHINELDSMKKYPNDIFYRGNIELLKRKKISIVGSRKPIQYSKLICHELSSKLSKKDICIVSGGAMGIDALAHQGANPNNTICILANGLDIKYPKVNTKLLNQIEKEGLLLSTYKDTIKATRYTFVHRNELVVALSDILIVIQAEENSGSLRSVEYALKMNKKVYTIAHRIGENKGLLPYIKNGQIEIIYDIDKFLDKYKSKIEKTNDDDFLDYCKSNPNYEKAVNKYSQLVFEYELNGKIMIKNGEIYIN